jgi:Tfp pilus assembly protein PilZ
MVPPMSDDVANRRAHPRAAVPEGSVVEFRGDSGTNAQAELANLSLSGVFLNTKKPAFLGEDLTMTIRIPGVDAVELRGRVARISQYRHAPGVAVNFLKEDRDKVAGNDKLMALIDDD